MDFSFFELFIWRALFVILTAASSFTIYFAILKSSNEAQTKSTQVAGDILLGLSTMVVLGCVIAIYYKIGISAGLTSSFLGPIVGSIFAFPMVDSKTN